MGNSTGHAPIQAAERSRGFTKNKYTFGVFIDLSEAFDIIDHHTLPRKLEHYDIKENNLK